MKKIAVIGGGRIGTAVKTLWEHIMVVKNVTVFDTKQGPIDEQVLAKYDIWVVATPFTENMHYMDLAAKYGKVYLDFTEDIDNRKYAELLAKRPENKATFIPCCGLAPGFVNIIANGLRKKFVAGYHINIMVGALPIATMHESKYAITWSPEGVANEYTKMPQAVKAGKIQSMGPLSGKQFINIDGREYEVARTSGGAGTLLETCSEFAGANVVDYKTIRYPGHFDIVENIVFEGGGYSEVLKYLKTIPHSTQDKVVVYIEVRGLTKEWGSESHVLNFVYEFQKPTFVNLTAIQSTTALGAIVWLKELVKTESPIIDPTKRFFKQEDFEYGSFVDSFRYLCRKVWDKELDFPL
jgi:saccharopine dehydrogenase-like NADP-dependent oxidoreductase